MQESLKEVFTLPVNVELNQSCRQLSVVNLDSMTCYIVSVLVALTVATRHGMSSCLRSDTDFKRAVKDIFLQPIMDWSHGSAEAPSIHVRASAIRDLRQSCFEAGWLNTFVETSPERLKQQCVLEFTEFVVDHIDLKRHVIVDTMKYDDGTSSRSKQDTYGISLGLPHDNESLSDQPARLEELLTDFFQVQKNVDGFKGTLQ